MSQKQTWSDTPLIEVSHVTFRYKVQANPTLRDVTFDIREGERVLIAGASGSGKSTMMRLLNGLIPSAYPGTLEGRILVGGRDAARIGIFELSKTVGTVLQDSDAQFVGLTAGEDIAFELENDMVPQRDMVSKVEEWANTFGVLDNLDIHPHSLSGGQKQRVAMAGVLVADSNILLLDEPLAALDPAAGYAALALLKDLCKHNPKLTVLIIEHRIGQVLDAQLVNRVLLMSGGQMVGDYTPRELIEQDQLRPLGLEEPRYVEILRRSGVDMTHIGHVESIDGVKTAAVLPAVQRYLNEVVNLDVNNHVGVADNSVSSTGQRSSCGDDRFLEVKHVGFAYPDSKPLFNDVSVSFARGQITGIVGRNGSGKTSLSHIIAGFLTPDVGSIVLDGENLAPLSLKQRAERIGYVLQNPNQMITQSIVFDEVASGLLLRGMSAQDAEPKVREALRLVGLDAMRHWPIGALSYGQKKRLTVASMLVLDPKVLILDEPTAGQDEISAQRLARFLRRRADEGMCVIVDTHDMTFLLSYASRAIVMSEGRVLADMEPYRLLADEELVNRASLRTTSAYRLGVHLGISDPARMNLLIADDKEND